MGEINKSTRRRITEMITEEEAADMRLSSDFDSEGILDYFRRAEVWVPTEVYANYVMSQDFDWYDLQFNVAFVPPGKQKVTWARVSLDFQEPVKQLGAWFPNDVFSSYKKESSTLDVTANMNLAVPDTLLLEMPYLKGLFPKLSAEYHKSIQEESTPTVSVIRAVSDRQRRLYYDLAEDPKSGIDQRQLTAQVVFGVSPGIGFPESQLLLSLSINCRCGALRLKSEICQDVDVTFLRQP
jgi:hypothetical protein